MNKEKHSAGNSVSDISCASIVPVQDQLPNSGKSLEPAEWTIKTEPLGAVGDTQDTTGIICGTARIICGTAGSLETVK